MILWTKDHTPHSMVTIAQRQGIAVDIAEDHELRSGLHRIRFTLRPNHPTFRRTYGRMRKTGLGVCWHAHYLFMQQLFEDEPDARLKSVLADYHGLRHFLELAPETTTRTGFESSTNCKCSITLPA